MGGLLVILVSSGVVAYAANVMGRNALYPVLQSCAFAQEKLGAPFPCLEADLARGYAVLRPPVGKPDTILAPLERIVGLEDPRLKAADTPNFFALAWAARHWMEGAPSDRDFALAVNSRLARSQDQLHIHLGCITPEFRTWIDRVDWARKPGEWVRAADLGPGLEFWTYRSGAADLAKVDPFRLLHRLFDDPAILKRTLLAVVLHEGEFVVVAARSRPGGWYAAADEVVVPRC